MPGGLEEDDLAAGICCVHEFANLFGGDDVLAALQDQGRHRDLGRSARLSDVKVTRANALAISGSVRQKLLVSSSPSSGRSGLPMIDGRHRGGPAHVVVVQKLEQLLDLLLR